MPKEGKEMVMKHLADELNNFIVRRTDGTLRIMKMRERGSSNCLYDIDTTSLAEERQRGRKKERGREDTTSLAVGRQRVTERNKEKERE